MPNVSARIEKLRVKRLHFADRELLQHLADGYTRMEAYALAGFESQSGGGKALNRLCKEHGAATHEHLLCLAVAVGWVTVE